MRFEWHMGYVVQNSFEIMCWGKLCERCVRFVSAMADQKAYLDDLKSASKILLKGLGMKLNNQNPGPPLKKKPKNSQEAEAMRKQESAERDARGRRTSELRDLELKKNEEEIKAAEETNKILREARHAAEAVAAATAGERFRGRGPPGQSSKGKEPAAAPAGDDDLTQTQVELLDRTREEVNHRECKTFLRKMRELVGRDPNESEEEARDTGAEDDGEKKKRKTRSKPKPRQLEFGILVEELYNALIVKLRRNKSKGNKDEIPKIILQFTGSDGLQYSDIKLGPTDNADCISPTNVVKVFCNDSEDNDMIFTWTRDTYAEEVARLPADHTVVKILRSRNIVIPKLI